MACRLRSAISAAITILAFLSTVTCVPRASTKVPNVESATCPWKVLSIRQLRPDEPPLGETSDISWSPKDARTLPGPDSLLLLVLNDEERRPHVYIKDLKAGESRLLLPGVASAPRWSPDGKYIACITWKSQARPWDLALVEVASGKIIEPSVDWSTTTIKWSPDSRKLLGEGLWYDGRGSVLYAVHLPNGKATILDTISIYSDYQYSWSRDSGWIVFSRPEKILHHEDVAEADLWIISPSGEAKCRLLDTPMSVERDPLWSKPNEIQIVRISWDGKKLGHQETVVIELGRDMSPK